MPKPLARVTDVAALEATTGACGRLELAVPEGWAATSVTLAIEAPRLLSCERCQGGGCDRCGKSGALRAPAAAAARRLELTLPAGVKEGTLVRIPWPFGDEREAEGEREQQGDLVIEQLIVVVRFAATPSRGVHRALVPAVAATTKSGPPPAVAIGLVLAVLVVLGVLVGMLR